MSERHFEGSTNVTEHAAKGMITLRGDLESAVLQKAVRSALEVTCPERGQYTQNGAFSMAWMSPDEALILTPHAEADAALAKLAKALDGSHHLLANVSDARAFFQLEGPQVLNVLAKLTPVDLRANHFKTGQVRRTHVSQVAAAFWMSETDTIDLICFRSVADYMWDLLSNAAR
ncbi:MAG: sarcosine oxidase subunit gamma family protein [Pseudomonadota bacterium]